MKLFYSALQGGQYTARQNPNGTWDIFRVPILSAHKRDLGPVVEVANGETTVTQNVFRVDAEWLRKAYEKSRRRYEQDAYMAPLHIRHHTQSATVERAGFVLPSEVGTLRYEGRDLPTLFADFVQVPQHVYEKIKRGELPYVSVEILDTSAEPEIDSCAILDHVVPYFKYPLLTIGAEIPSPTVSVLNGEHASPMIAYARHGRRASLLYYAGPVEQRNGDEEKKKNGNEKQKEAAAEEIENESEGEKEEELTMTDRLLAAFQDFAAKFQAILSSMGNGGAAKRGGLQNPTPPDQGGVVMASKSAANVPAATYTASGASVTTSSDNLVATTVTTDSGKSTSWLGSAEYAAMRGELDAIRGQLESMTKDAELRAKAKALAVKLAAYAVNEDDIYKLAKDGGDAALAAYEAAILKHGRKDSAVRFDADATISTDAYPAEVLAYNSPEKVKKAAEYWEAYKALGNRAGKTTLKEFLANCMSLDESYKKIGG